MCNIYLSQEKNEGKFVKIQNLILFSKFYNDVLPTQFNNYY
jgi:hypothetical protein